MGALMVWSSIAVYMLIGGFTAGRVYTRLRLQDANFDTPGPVFMIIGAFVAWWVYLAAAFSLWSAKKGLASDELRRLLHEKEQVDRWARISKLEQSNLSQRSITTSHEHTLDCDDWCRR